MHTVRDDLLAEGKQSLSFTKIDLFYHFSQSKPLYRSRLICRYLSYLYLSHARNYGTTLFLLIIIISFVFSLIPKHIRCTERFHAKSLRRTKCKLPQSSLLLLSCFLLPLSSTSSYSLLPITSCTLSLSKSLMG